MLLYQIGATNSHLFVIPPAGQPAVSVPLMFSEDQARVLGESAGSVTSASLERVLNRPEDTREAGRGLVTMMASRPSRGLGASGAQLPLNELHALWHVLVPDSIKKQLLASREVVIIPDGSLHALPFEVLVTAPAAKGEAARYWLDDGPVTRYAPSAAVLFNLTRRPAAGLFPSAAATVLSVSNPIYSPAEVATRGGAETRHSTPAPDAVPSATTRNAYERFGGSLLRLPGTALETEAILQAYQAEASRAVHVLQDLRADESSVRGALTGKRYLHVATHALVGGNRGTLFASLVLTPPAAETADPNADGFLQLHEIYELKLAGVDLAILSACDTNRGKMMDNEGVFALSRGFLAAGAHRVIASQWAVNDDSTAQLMSALFRQVVDDERNARPVDFGRAMRDARRAIRSQPQWSHPYYWAPFVLTGRQ
jgi:CHAT domain-containing protein